MGNCVAPTSHNVTGPVVISATRRHPVAPRETTATKHAKQPVNEEQAEIETAFSTPNKDYEEGNVRTPDDSCPKEKPTNKVKVKPRAAAVLPLGNGSPKDEGCNDNEQNKNKNTEKPKGRSSTLALLTRDASFVVDNRARIIPLKPRSSNDNDNDNKLNGASQSLCVTDLRTGYPSLEKLGEESRSIPDMDKERFIPNAATPVYYDRAFYDDFTKIKSLGSGKFGEVRLVQHKMTGEKFAAKVFYKEGHHLYREGDFSEDEMQKEFLMMSSVAHPDIIRLEAVYDERERCTLLLQLAKGGDMRHYILRRIEDSEKCIAALKKGELERNKNLEGNNEGCLANPSKGIAALQWRPCGTHGLLTEREIAHYMVDAFAAVAYLHANRIAHRDIKIENFLRLEDRDDTDLLLCDFGFAARLAKDHSFAAYCGSLLYMAPEVVVMKREHRRIAEKTKYFASRVGTALKYGLQCDMWSLGVCLYVLLCAEQPFNAADRKGMVLRILNGNFNRESDGWKSASVEVRTLVRRLLSVNAEDRPTAIKVLMHDPWINKHAYDKATDKIAELSRLVDAKRTDLSRDDAT